jgi:hypothetical protein
MMRGQEVETPKDAFARAEFSHARFLLSLPPSAHLQAEIEKSVEKARAETHAKPMRAMRSLRGPRKRLIR